MVLYFLATLKITNRNAKLRKESNEKDIEQTGLRNESLSSFETVKAFLFEIYFSTYNNSTSLRKNTNLGGTEKSYVISNPLSRSGCHIYRRIGCNVLVMCIQRGTR